ncbi:1-acyl-sn-glycerol-3-phosphate acyltransferase [Moorena sp. SIO1F2]|uniref:1-acyl-sn-glycerol-3-phosphate acyltransferase n=1 Tax=Moorena sp. SIO1F2 TaxID=2607819 RepID=UPI0025EAA406|nr:1-acyl-sn-glycerol-3-phosphate acyltransferase [Moorena sp. SIO1F2]
MMRCLLQWEDKCSNIDEDRIPHKSAVVVVSNHPGFLDVPLLMVALGQPIPIACDHYMGQVPVMRVGCPADGLFPSRKTRKYTVGVFTTGKFSFSNIIIGLGCF